MASLTVSHWAFQAAQPQADAAAKLVFSLVRAQLARQDPKPTAKKRGTVPQPGASKAATPQVQWNSAPITCTCCRSIARSRPV